MLSQYTVDSNSKNMVFVTLLNDTFSMKEMQGIYENLIKDDKKDSEVLEEMAKKLYREEFSLIYTKTMQGLYYVESKNFFEGCVHEYPSQRDHDCLTIPVEERVELLFKLL